LLVSRSSPRAAQGDAVKFIIEILDVEENRHSLEIDSNVKVQFDFASCLLVFEGIATIDFENSGVEVTRFSQKK
jgi:hypothetical protein